MLQDKKQSEHSIHTPPRIPPRHHILRQPMSLSHINSHETVIELTQIPNSPLENKMSINVTTRSPNISISKGKDISFENNVSKLQVTSANSPLISKTKISNNSIPNNGNYFMRGAFKSSSVNYGNYMRRSVESNQSSKLNGSRHGHLSPQLFYVSPGRIIGSQLTGNIMTNRYQYKANSPSLNSDSSSSHSPHDSEKETDSAICSNNNTNNNSNNISNNIGNVSCSRPLNLVTNGNITVGENGKSSSNGAISNESVQNALNNNTTDSTTTICTSNGVANDNTNNSNSIWYEYGCV